MSGGLRVRGWFATAVGGVSPASASSTATGTAGANGPTSIAYPTTPRCSSPWRGARARSTPVWAPPLPPTGTCCTASTRSRSTCWGGARSTCGTRIRVARPRGRHAAVPHRRELRRGSGRPRPAVGRPDRRCHARRAELRPVRPAPAHAVRGQRRACARPRRPAPRAREVLRSSTPRPRPPSRACPCASKPPCATGTFRPRGSSPSRTRSIRLRMPRSSSRCSPSATASTPTPSRPRPRVLRDARHIARVLERPSTALETPWPTSTFR